MMITVIIPSYNSNEKLTKLLHSLSAQSLDDFKVIVVDDCSDTPVKEVTDNFKNLDIKLIRNEKNIGVGMSRQVGIDNLNTDYFIFADSDDLLLPFAIEAVEEIIKKTNSEYVISPFYIQDSSDGFKLFSQNQGYTWCHGKVYRKSALKKFGISNKSDYSYWADDSYLNAQCLELLKITECKIPWYVWVQNGESLTHTTPLQQKEKDIILLKAMIDSAEKVLKYKDKVVHINNTIAALLNKKPFAKRSQEEQQLIVELYKMNGGDDYAKS
ncbi:MAG: glycosyltransferase family A protein [Eubacteriales bacterium]|nr:glycosyltransferase family A protein [Eubacteriales bacterium]